jgi:SAM-dependent methyltransferase
MHKESYELMSGFVQKNLDPNKKIDVLDIGSYDVNGSYRKLFTNSNWNYFGFDIAAGPNVDLTPRSIDDWDLNRKFDVVISGNCLEHVEAPWKWVAEVEKIIKKDGLLCITVPFSIGEHKFPLDCWRILPDGFHFLLEKSSTFKILECYLNKPKYKRYQFFSKNPKMFWMLNLLPFLKKKLEFEIDGTVDTFVVARKI